MKTYTMYTDGSHFKNGGSGRLGCGGVLVEETGGYGTEVDRYWEELKPEYLEEHFGSSAVSNPTAEMIGVLRGLMRFNIPKGSEVTVKADYAGVKSWMNGTWKIKEPYIQKVKNEIDKTIRDKGIKVSFDWVKGHQRVHDKDSYWNNETDKLAKGL